MEGIHETNFKFERSDNFYRGKVRDVYFFDDRMAIVTTDRISAFDVVLPKSIPYKGWVLNQVAWQALKESTGIVPNWVEAMPHPMVMIGKRCIPYPIEMVIRGYLTGHAWREYKAGKRELCGVLMPDGMKEHDPFPTPIITPATKAEEGHDEDISREEILERGLVDEKSYRKMEEYTRRLFAHGTKRALEKGLILVDTKYEFGNYHGQVYLIDEIHTPDSSRYFYAEGYEARQKEGMPQKQLSKEFVREWLIQHNFQGREGEILPEMTEEFVSTVTERYLELYKQLSFEAVELPDNSIYKSEVIEERILSYFNRLMGSRC